MPDPSASNGRGLALMGMATDQLELSRRETGGLSVRMSKGLLWIPDAIGAPTR